MTVDLTDAQLRAAWEAMRTRHGLSTWPKSFDEVMADRRRGQLVRLEAQAAVRSAARRVPLLTCQPFTRAERVAPSTKPQQPYLLDRKRAAAGDRDD